MKKYLILSFFLLFTGTTFAVPPPEFGIPAWENYTKDPEIAAFMRYFEIPVSYSTGVHNLSIPIHTLSAGGIELPISLSYHASGIKVRDVATVAGLGWSLNAGGTIVRQIKGTQDGGTIRIKNTQFLDNLIQQGIGNRQSSNDNSAITRWIINDIENIRNGYQDNLADEYYFNLGGRMGMFYQGIADDSGVLQNSFYTIPYSQVKIDYNNPTKTFTLTDEAGTRYIFGNCLGSSQTNAVTYAHTWTLNQIISSNKTDTLTIEYRTQVIDSRGLSYSGYYFKETYLDYDGITHRETPQVPHHSQEMVSNLNYLPSRIKLRNTTVDFIYANDRGDARSIWVSNLRLSGVEVKVHGILVKKAVLNHDYVDNQSMTLYPPTGGSVQNKRMFLNNVTFPNTSGSTSEPIVYKFAYNETRLPSYVEQLTHVNTENFSYPEDHWGYYNGRTNNHSLLNVPDYYLTDPVLKPDMATNPNAIQAGILTRVTYPAGGYAQFTYETHEMGGGVRVKQIDYGTSTGIQQTKSYTYSSPEYDYYDLTGYYREEMVGLHVDEYRYNMGLQAYLETDIWAFFSPSRDPFNLGKDRYYRTVVERDGTGNGRTIYTYQKMEAPGNIASQHQSLQNLSNYTMYTNRLPGSIASPEELVKTGYNPPLLVKQTVESASGSILSEKSYHYGFLGPDETRPLGVKFKFKQYLPYGAKSWIPDGVYMNGIYVGEMLAYVNPLKLTSVVETQDGVTRTTEYEYDARYQLKQTKTTNSNGETFFTKMYYPYDNSGSVYTAMVTQNRISDVIRTEQYKTNTSIASEIARTETTYLNSDNQINPNITRLSYSRATAFEDSKVGKYDPKGNPVWITDRGRDVIYLWSYGYRHVVAEIRNATWAQVSSYVNLSTLGACGYSNPAVRDNMLTTLKNGLPSASITTYEYSPFGMVKQTDPSGRFQTYEYDGHGRLQRVLDQDGKVLEQYDYHYANQ